MTDEQAFVEMCKRFGVILTPSENKQPAGLAGIASAWSIEAHKGPKQIGYCEFISDWCFDADGKFVGVGTGNKKGVSRSRPLSNYTGNLVKSYPAARALFA